MTGEKIPELERVGQTSRNSIGGNQKGKRGKDMKTFKKVLASTLAAAMVITALPVTPANAAATPKLSTTKAAVYVGGSKTLSVKTPSNWKKVKVKATSNKKSIAKISKVSGKKITVKAVKKGKAKVTVKVTAKKAGKKVSKTLKATVTVKNPTLTASVSKTTLNVGDTAQIKVKKTPSSSKIKYSSTDAAVATVSAGKVKAIAPGTAYVVVTSTYGKKKVTKKIKVTVKATKDGLTSTLTNELSSDYPNTVLVSNAAIVNVVYAKDGKPVSGETVVLDFTGGTDADDHYTVNNYVATTNTSGVATFVISNKTYGIKSNNTAEVASVNYKVQVPSSGASTEGTVNFAAITNSDVVNVNNTNSITTDDLVPSTNYSDATRKGVAETTSMDMAQPLKSIAQQIKNVDYVESQQVSSNGGNEHAVTMTGGYPMIYLPGSTTVVDNATKMTDEINYTSAKYKTYANDSYYYELKEDPNKLTYATLNFDKITLSKYTRLVVETFANKAAAEKSKNPGVANNGSLDQKIYDGEMAQSSVGYQIPLGSGYAKLCVKVTLQSAGQVDMAKNDGYVAKNVVYVYKTAQTSGRTAVAMKNASVDWSIAATPYTDESKVTTGGSFGLTLASGEYLTQKLPVFPYTGTAIITKYDSNNKVVAYYALATCNNGQNQNVIDPAATIYQISADELRDKVGEITSQNGTSVTVDSKQSGRMTLEGAVKIDGKVISNAELASVYTSVQWNPIPKTTTSTSDAFVALLGQKIELIAQLTDKNGNAVSESGHGISFKDGNKTYEAADTQVSGARGKAAIVNTLSANTDANGQAKMILKASEITEIVNMKAESKSSQYDAKLIIAGKSTDNADLYWIDADLTFTDKVQAGAKTVTTSTKDPAKTTTGLDIKPDAGTTWMYGVKTVGTGILNGSLATKTISIDGLGITMSKSTTSVGTIESLADVKGAVKATSTKGGTMEISGKIDSATLTTGVTVSEGTFAGKGATSINKKLTIDVEWKAAGLTASYVNPTGTRTTDNTKNVFLKVTDNYGNAVSGTAVKFKVDNGSVSTSTVNTNEDGIAKVTLTKGDEATSTVSATVAGVSNETYDQTFVWVDSAKTLEINAGKDQVNDTFLTYYDKDKKTVTLTFNDDIVASSVVKEMFEVKYAAKGNDSNVNTLVVKSVAVNDNVVTLTLGDVPSLVDANDIVKVTITANKTVKSVDYTLTSVSGSAYTKNYVSIKLDGITAPSEH